MTRGEAAERRVRDALRAALPTEWRIHANCRWLGRDRSGAHERRGEADVVIVAPDGAILVLDAFVHLGLVAEGYAQVSTYPPDVMYADVLLVAQRATREEARGLWGGSLP